MRSFDNAHQLQEGGDAEQVGAAAEGPGLRAVWGGGSGGGHPVPQHQQGVCAVADCALVLPLG